MGGFVGVCGLVYAQRGMGGDGEGDVRGCRMGMKLEDGMHVVLSDGGTAGPGGSNVGCPSKVTFRTSKD